MKALRSRYRVSFKARPKLIDRIHYGPEWMLRMKNFDLSEMQAQSKENHLQIVVSLNALKRKMLFGSTKNLIDKILVNGTIRHSILTKLCCWMPLVSPEVVQTRHSIRKQLRFTIQRLCSVSMHSSTIASFMKSRHFAQFSHPSKPTLAKWTEIEENGGSQRQCWIASIIRSQLASTSNSEHRVAFNYSELRVTRWKHVIIIRTTTVTMPLQSSCSPITHSSNQNH